MNTFFDLQAPYLTDKIYPSLVAKSEQLAKQYDDLQLPSGPSAEAIRSWINRIVSTYNVTTTHWAKIANISPSTINRFVNSEQSIHTLSSSTVSKLSKAVRERIASHKHLPEIIEDFRDKKLFPTALCTAVFVDQIFDPHENSERLGSFDGDTIRVPVFSPLERITLAAISLSSRRHAPVFKSSQTLICAPISCFAENLDRNYYVVAHTIDDQGDVTVCLWELSKDPAGKLWLIPVGDKAIEQDQSVYLGTLDRTPASDKSMVVTYVVVGVHSHEQMARSGLAHKIA